jgi:hypothetical protein
MQPFCGQLLKRIWRREVPYRRSLLAGWWGRSGGLESQLVFACDQDAPTHTPLGRLRMVAPACPLRPFHLPTHLYGSLQSAPLTSCARPCSALQPAPTTSTTSCTAVWDCEPQMVCVSALTCAGTPQMHTRAACTSIAHAHIFAPRHAHPSLAEIEKHNDSKSCWIAVNGSV